MRGATLEKEPHDAKPLVVFKSDLAESRSLIHRCLSAYARFDDEREKCLERINEYNEERLASWFDVSGGDEIQGAYYELDNNRTVDEHYPTLKDSCKGRECKRKPCRNRMVAPQCVNKDQLSLIFHNAVAVGYELFQHKETNRCYNDAYIKAGEAILTQKAYKLAGIDPLPVRFAVCGSCNDFATILNYCERLNKWFQDEINKNQSNSELLITSKNKLEILITNFVSAILSYKKCRKAHETKAQFYYYDNDLIRELSNILAFFEEVSKNRYFTDADLNEDHKIYISIIKYLKETSDDGIYDVEQRVRLPIDYLSEEEDSN